MLRRAPPHIYSGGYDCSGLSIRLMSFSHSVLLSDKPDVVVATPSRVLNLLQSKVRLPHTKHV